MHSLTDNFNKKKWPKKSRENEKTTEQGERCGLSLYIFESLNFGCWDTEIQISRTKIIFLGKMFARRQTVTGKYNYKHKYNPSKHKTPHCSKNKISCIFMQRGFSASCSIEMIIAWLKSHSRKKWKITNTIFILCWQTRFNLTLIKCWCWRYQQRDHTWKKMANH